MIKELRALQNALCLTMEDDYPDLIKDNPLLSINIEQLPEHRLKDEYSYALVLRFLEDGLVVTLEACIDYPDIGSPSTFYKLYASNEKGNYSIEIVDTMVIETIQTVPKNIEKEVKKQEEESKKLNTKYLKQLEEL